MKNKIIISLILVLIILSFAFVYFNFFTKSEYKVKVTNVDTGKNYIVGQGEKVECIEIIDIGETTIKIKHLKNIDSFKYNREYDFWPDSQGGKIMWDAPEGTYIFEKN